VIIDLEDTIIFDKITDFRTSWMMPRMIVDSIQNALPLLISTGEGRAVDSRLSYSRRESMKIRRKEASRYSLR